MNLLYIIYTHNREKVLEQCLSSLFNKNTTKPDRVLIIDDGSNLDVKNSLYQFSLQNSSNIPIDFLCYS